MKKNIFEANIINIMLFVMSGCHSFPLNAANGGNIPINIHGTYTPEAYTAQIMYLCMLDSAYPAINCQTFSLTPPEAGGVFEWTDKSNCWSLKMSVVGTAQTSLDYPNKDFNLVQLRSGGAEKWTIQPSKIAPPSTRTYNWGIDANVSYQWVSLCPNNTKLPDGTVRLVFFMTGPSLGTGIAKEYPIFNSVTPGPVIPPTPPQTHCSVRVADIDVNYGKLAAGQVGSLPNFREPLKIDCSGNTSATVSWVNCTRMTDTGAVCEKESAGGLVHKVQISRGTSSSAVNSFPLFSGSNEVLVDISSSASKPLTYGAFKDSVVMNLTYD
ncbi:hypothetical protein ACLE3B_001032 [Salmonella enterica subsp. enterica serovar Chester]